MADRAPANDRLRMDPARRQRRQLVVVLAGGLVLILVNVLLIIRVVNGRTRNPYRTGPGLVLSAASLVVVIALVAWAVRVVMVREGRLRGTHEMLQALERITEPVLEHRPFQDLLEVLVARVAEVMGAVSVAIIVKNDADALVVRAAAGRCPLTRGSEVPTDEGLAASVFRGRKPEVAGPGEPAERSPLCPDAAAVACPLLISNLSVGVLEAAFATPEEINDELIRLLQVLADRVAVAVQDARLRETEQRSQLAAEHARGHLALIAQASRLFATAFDEYEPVLAKLADLMVPGFADWCVVELSDHRGRLRLLSCRDAIPGREEELYRVVKEHKGWEGPIRTAVANGRAELRYGILNPTGSAPFVDDFTAVLRTLAIDSIIVLPIRVRGLSLGALAVGRRSDRRGFRPSDLSAGEDIATRAAVAVERVLLYRETLHAADAAAGHADQLRRLVQAGLEITAPLSRPAVLRVLAEQARLVLNGDYGVAWLDAPGTSLRFSSPPGPDSGPRPIEESLSSVIEPSVTVAIPVTLSSVKAGVEVRRRGEVRFTSEDEALLASMAQMAAVALQNARLFQAMEANEERLGALVEAAPLAIVDLDLRKQPRRWNRAAQELFGWPEQGGGDEEEPARPAFPDRTAAALTPLCDRAEIGQATLDAELVGEEPGGRPMQLSVSTVPLRDRFGEVNGILAVLSDITARKQLEEQLLQSQRMEAIGRLAGGIAHDFNNLLTVILGYSDLLLRRMKDDETARADLEAVRSAGQQAAKLTTQLLAVGRRQVVEPTVIEVGEVLGSMEPVLRRVITEDVQVEIESGPGRVLIDPSNLEQVVLNLVVNAGDAMADGGRLVIDCRELHVDRPMVANTGTLVPGDYVVLSVSDTGTGMPPDVVEHCFEPFFTTKDRTKGTGLGLATVYGIVAQNGGFIQIETAMGEGTSIRVLLPCATGEVEHEEAGESPEWLPPGFEQVLLVEDERAVRDLACDVLTEHGYRVLEASNGTEALELARVHDGDIDMLVTDVIMPGMDGVELARRLAESHPDLAVLFVSGYTGSAREKLEAVTRSANFLAKPFAPEELVRRVRELLDARAAARTS